MVTPLGKIDLEKMFHDEPVREVTMGVELEAFIVEYDDFFNTYTLFEDEEELHAILMDYDDRYVYKDYYPYQAEIRSAPYKDVDKIVEDFVERYKAFEDFITSQTDCKLVPVSSFRGGEVSCGMHIHISLDQPHTIETLTHLGYAIYPFILMLGKFTSSSKVFTTDFGNLVNHWNRLISSRHIKPVEFYDLEYMSSMVDRYFDWSINRYTDNNRQRAKEVVTLELRLFDSVGDRQFLRDLLSSIKTIVERIDTRYYFADLLYLKSHRFVMAHPKKQPPFGGLSIYKLVKELGLDINPRKDSWIGDEYFIGNARIGRIKLAENEWFRG